MDTQQMFSLKGRHARRRLGAMADAKEKAPSCASIPAQAPHLPPYSSPQDTPAAASHCCANHSSPRR